jgi:metallo-beta-lactamase family protein
LACSPTIGDGDLSITFLGGVDHIGGSCTMVEVGGKKLLLDLGSELDEQYANELPAAALHGVSAVVLTHAHTDHSGLVPMLVREGFRGPVFATPETCAVLPTMWDMAVGFERHGDRNFYFSVRSKQRVLHWKKECKWGRRIAKGNYRETTMDSERIKASEFRRCWTCSDIDVGLALDKLRAVPYGKEFSPISGIIATYHDAGHIIGSSIVELVCTADGESRTLVFSGDLGFRDAPVMNPVTQIKRADAVLMESTYGDRLHRPIEETLDELTDVFDRARAAQGNILIPAFTVGRTQDLLHLMAENYLRWNLGDWHIFLDSPMAIKATEVYSHFRHLYDTKLFGDRSDQPKLPNLHQTRSPEESMVINQVESGAIIIAGSGMCSGGRILHHLKHNVWRPECHLVIVGFQAYGTLGRRLVDGAEAIRLWGEEYRVRIQVHTIGGLSAHADQRDLVDWYRGFENRPPVYLVHGEERAQRPLLGKLKGASSGPQSGGFELVPTWMSS